MEKRALEELNVIDDFLFQELVTRDKTGKKFCRILLKTILGKNIREVRIVPQKNILGTNTYRHGIRIDAYIEAAEEPTDTNTASTELEPVIYDIEPNKYATGSEPKRTRYYHSLIDVKILKSGTDYRNLKNVVIIMILPYDPFGKNRMVYTAKTQLVEEPELDYDDGATTIYLYTKGTEGKPGQKLQDMLNYMQNSVQENVKNKDLEEIHRLVTEIKQDEEVGISYMKSWEWERYIEERSREEGRKEGEEAGRQIELVSLVCKKLRKNCTVQEIADMLEQEEDVIQQICDAAVNDGPDYDLEKIISQLNKK